MVARWVGLQLVVVAAPLGQLVDWCGGWLQLEDEVSD